MMADIKWIKIATDIFDDEKILLIESMPAADSIITIWFKLLALAGKQNNSGVFMMNDRLAYTDEMLATIFRRDISIVRLALNTFEQFEMIEIIEGVITIPKWEKHQNIDGMERIREQTRKRVAKHREKERLACNVTVTESNAGRIDKDKNKIRIEEDKNILVNKKLELNNKTLVNENISDIPESDDSASASSEKSNRKKKSEPVRHKYGMYQNVLLSDEEMEKLKAEFPDDWAERIEELSEGIDSKGYKYKNFLSTIRKWARDGHKPYRKNSNAPNQNRNSWLDQMINDENTIEGEGTIID